MWIRFNDGYINFDWISQIDTCIEDDSYLIVVCNWEKVWIEWQFNSREERDKEYDRIIAELRGEK